jgi:protein required for attachment to host cells
LLQDKTSQNSQQKSSSDSEPTTPGAGMWYELRLTKDTLAEIKNSMVKMDDIKSIVTIILAEMKGEIKSEIIAEVKETVTKEITENVKMHVKGDCENQIDQNAKAFAAQTKEIADEMNMDKTNIREKFQEHSEKCSHYRSRRSVSNH